MYFCLPGRRILRATILRIIQVSVVFCLTFMCAMEFGDEADICDEPAVQLVLWDELAAASFS
jgi:hypothetical protein